MVGAGAGGGASICRLTVPLTTLILLRMPPWSQGEWIYMIESDYVFMKPLQLPSQESQVRGKSGSGGWG
jgi:hypothetical protein